MKFRATVSQHLARWSPTNHTQPHGGQNRRIARPTRRAVITAVAGGSTLATAAARYVGSRAPGL